jgi:hypothetical protein
MDINDLTIGQVRELTKLLSADRGPKPSRIVFPDRPYVIIRGKNAGVHAGNLESLDHASQSCVLLNARRIWQWSGAASLSELAVYGAKNADKCRFGAEVHRQEIVGDVCEVIYCQPKGAKMIREQEEWRS